MKYLRYLVFSLVFLVPMIVFGEGISLSKTSLTLEVNGTSNVTITANSCYAKYTITSSNDAVAKVTSSLSFDADKESKTITIKGISPGTAKINVKAWYATYQSEEEFTKYYTINVTVNPPKSKDATLASLKINNVLVNDFSSSKEVYNLGNTNDSSINISATTNDSKAKVSGVGNKTLKYGNNTFKVVVTAENGSKKTYTISIKRNDSRNGDSTLKSLIPSVGIIDFKPNIKEYNIVVSNDIKVVSVKGVVNASTSKITYKPSSEIVLSSNKETIKLVVTAENTSSTIYVVNFIREEDNSNPKLKSIGINGVNFQYNENIYEYNIEVDESINKLDFNIESYPGTSYEVIDNELVNTNNKVLVKVDSNGKIGTYVFNVIKVKTDFEESHSIEENKEVCECKNEDKCIKGLYVYIIIAIFIIIIGILVFIIIRLKSMMGK